MNNCVLITRPDHDLATNYLYLWTEDVVKLSNTKRKTLDLKGRKATAKNFRSYIEKHQPAFIFINGHGNEFEITGYDNETLVRVGRNEYLLKDKIIYARSCDAAKVLGEKLSKEYGATFIGYIKSFILGRNPSKAGHPLTDEVAKLFLKPSNLISITIIKGNTAKEAYRKSREAMMKNFFFMLSSNANSNQKDAAPYLWTNKKNQVLLGDQNAKLSS